MQGICKEQMQQQQEQPTHLNNHFSHNLATTTTTTTTAKTKTKTISGNNGIVNASFYNNNNKNSKLKRLSVLSTTMPKQQQQQQQQQYYLQPLTPQQCQQYLKAATATSLRKSQPKSSLNNYTYTLQNTQFATKRSSATVSATSAITPRNSLSNKDLNIYEFASLNNCDPDPNDDYYMPSTMEILGIQKSLEHNIDDDNVDDGNNDDDIDASDSNESNVRVDHGNVSEDDINDVVLRRHVISDSVESVENIVVDKLLAVNGLENDYGDSKSIQRISANLNDLELKKNATNNLLKQQQQQQTKHDDDKETNRLWYH